MQETFNFFCPNCNFAVDTKVIAIGNDNGIEEVEDAIEQYMGKLIITQCPRCYQPFLLRQSRFMIDPNAITQTKEILLYPREDSTTFEKVPEQLAQAYHEARRTLKISPTGSALLARRLLEVLCNNKGAKGDNLRDKLDDLEKKGIIDSRLKDWAHGVRLVGNEAAHQTELDTTKQDVDDVLDFAKALLLYIYDLTEKFNDFIKRRQ